MDTCCDHPGQQHADTTSGTACQLACGAGSPVAEHTAGVKSVESDISPCSAATALHQPHQPCSIRQGRGQGRVLPATTGTNAVQPLHRQMGYLLGFQDPRVEKAFRDSRSSQRRPLDLLCMLVSLLLTTSAVLLKMTEADALAIQLAGMGAEHMCPNNLSHRPNTSSPATPFSLPTIPSAAAALAGHLAESGSALTIPKVFSKLQVVVSAWVPSSVRARCQQVVAVFPTAVNTKQITKLLYFLRHIKDMYLYRMVVRADLPFSAAVLLQLCVMVAFVRKCSILVGHKCRETVLAAHAVVFYLFSLSICWPPPGSEPGVHGSIFMPAVQQSTRVIVTLSRNVHYAVLGFVVPCLRVLQSWLPIRVQLPLSFIDWVFVCSLRSHMNGGPGLIKEIAGMFSSGLAGFWAAVKHELGCMFRGEVGVIQGGPIRLFITWVLVPLGVLYFVERKARRAFLQQQEQLATAAGVSLPAESTCDCQGGPALPVEPTKQQQLAAGIEQALPELEVPGPTSVKQATMQKTAAGSPTQHPAQSHKSVPVKHQEPCSISRVVAPPAATATTMPPTLSAAAAAAAAGKHMAAATAGYKAMSVAAAAPAAAPAGHRPCLDLHALLHKQATSKHTAAGNSPAPAGSTCLYQPNSHMVLVAVKVEKQHPGSSSRSNAGIFKKPEGRLAVSAVALSGHGNQDDSACSAATAAAAARSDTGATSGWNSSSTAYNSSSHTITTLHDDHNASMVAGMKAALNTAAHAAAARYQATILHTSTVSFYGCLQLVMQLTSVGWGSLQANHVEHSMEPFVSWPAASSSATQQSAAHSANHIAAQKAAVSVDATGTVDSQAVSHSSQPGRLASAVADDGSWLDVDVMQQLLMQACAAGQLDLLSSSVHLLSSGGRATAAKLSDACSTGMLRLMCCMCPVTHYAV